MGAAANPPAVQPSSLTLAAAGTSYREFFAKGGPTNRRCWLGKPDVKRSAARRTAPENPYFQQNPPMKASQDGSTKRILTKVPKI